MSQLTQRPLFEWDWVASHGADIAALLGEHLVLTGIAIGLGVLIAATLSAAVLRWRRLYPAVLAATGVLFTIPSLALFALLVPLTGLTRTTAEIALVSYTLLILVRNVVTGIDAVPASVREAAIGMGYGRARLLLRVELPLAMPIVFAGLRVATVTVVGLVTVTALIGLGGLGSLILDGLRRSILFPTPVIVGTVLSVALAAALDLGLLALQRMLTPWTRRVTGT